MKIKPIRKRKSTASKKAGLPPGSIVYVGKERLEEAALELISYNATELSKKNYENCEVLQQNLHPNSVNWINVDGIHNDSVIHEFNTVFDLDRLLLEDVTNTNQRPKVEEYENYLFLSLKMLHYHEATKTIDSEQVSLVLAKEYVISFQEKTGDVFGHIRERIEVPKGQIRGKKNDYLFYCLIDSIIDNYFVAIENIGNDLEELEDEIFSDPSQKSLEKIHANKNILLVLRRSVYPLRESINKLLRDNDKFIHPKTIKYFNDVYDHTIQIIDILESYKDVVSGLKDSYLSSLSLKMNQVMQVLTIMATIFIPLTFLAGIYGMNFDNIPELHWKNGYYYFWGFSIFIFIVLLVYFKRKKWL
ncbi:magnesium/cobalt transporter CorA [Aureibaculum sp. 2210JD6-5]|uniref:magnesium/cobalt transporter CorA n=1 Tax=Aureibaculum sp. 2210JD6-5 TaxID=3103957 RepID=UPI002AACF304|nr:magnesium/cobalt transporter CorA [Aureibaculum sp. 2210JD6-5]MDY7395056.1 magnesium/cobalt transporter CorA [Aureibaculum sp. 2210JD6-5]